MPTQPSPPPPPEDPSLPVSVAGPLLSSFTTFLTLTLHSLLYHRVLYPPATFLTVRAFNLPVHQSRHPGLCMWINDAVAAVAQQLQDGVVRRIAVVMHAPNKKLSVLERWVFDVEAFPEWGNVLFEDEEDEDAENAEEDEDVEEDEDAAAAAEGEEEEEEDDNDDEEEEEEVNWTDINESLRGALRRIAHVAESKPPLPGGSTFTLAVELRDEAPPPIGHPQPWIPSQTNRQPPSRSRPNRGSSLRGSSLRGSSRRGTSRRVSLIRGSNTVPIRSVQAGPLFFECWMEESSVPSSS